VRTNNAGSGSGTCFTILLSRAEEQRQGRVA